MTTWLLSACASQVPLTREVPVRALQIQNPAGQEVRLHRVGGGTKSLGRAQHLALDLEADRYFVEAGGLSYPVPLLADLVSSDRVLELSILATVPGDPGFVLVPGGPTLIGDVIGVGSVDERPARIVDVDAFFAAATETTNAEYLQFLMEQSFVADDWLDLGGPKCRIRRDAEGQFVTDAPNLPVVTVSLRGAVAYCDWRSARTGLKHRLPTEEEWERMARGPQSSTFSYGDVYDPEAANQASGRLLAAKSFPPTGWGLYDLTGNAFEWTLSEYRPGLVVLKGGSYVLDGPFLRNSFRMWYRPEVQADDIGFRVVKEVQR